MQSLKSPADTSILFVRKPNGNFHLYVNYWDINNLIIKNQYLLLLINKSLDQLGQVKRFIQLDLTNIYY